MPNEYRLPRSVAERLETALQGRKNATATLVLATFLARFWSSPRRLLMAFPIDRRAIAGRDDLGLSEARVRGALATLVEVGFLARYEPDAGKRYQRTEGGLQRRAILHRFGEEFAVEFSKANARAQAKRGTPAPARRPVEKQHGVAFTRPFNVPGWNLENRVPAQNPISQLAQKHPTGGSRVIMGEEVRPVPDSPLEVALARWAKAIGG